MAKELNIEKIIKRVQSDSDKRFEKIVKHFEKKVDVLSTELKGAEKRLDSRFDGLTEILNEKFEIVTEQFKGVYEKFDMIDERFDSVEKTLDTHTNILHAHTNTLNSHTERIGNVLMDMTEVKRSLTEVKFHIVGTLDNKLDKKHFVDLDTRLRRLEKK